MKKISLRLLALLVALVAILPAGAYTHSFDSVPGDPMHSLIYTLPNGLKVFMTVNKDQPRIQTYVAVRVGGKNDPAETTGLAHYFEHLMFKGTKQFGTSDYAAEKPMLDKIEQLFEVYRKTTDEAERARIYKEIDSISYQASLIAIPNEYDKLMAAIGATGTNAYTSQDVTCYVEDIPSNQIENWAMIQADRFENPEIRGFHTELETIYEEKNMSLTRDSRKMGEAMLTALFPNHPYGTQTVLGTQENLKNPSITNVKNYHKQWYVPNNMAICLSGDFDPDNMVDIISRYFGHLKPNNNLPVLEVKAEEPITTPLTVEVKGPEAEQLYLAWRLPAAKHEDRVALDVMGEVLSNGKSGLLDLNVNQKQLMLGAGAGNYGLSDQDAFILIGRPKQGQTLDQVRDILLDQVDSLLQGRFADELISAIVNNTKLHQQYALEDNGSRADMFVNAFVNGESWADAVASLSAVEKVTKQDVLDVARKYLGRNNYAAIYKRQGKDENELKLAKPAITPIATNRDKSSDFLRRVQQSEVEPIEPVFVDYDRDLTFLTAKENTPVLYTRNNSNDVFQVTYIFETGSAADRLLPMATSYLSMLGTDDMTPEQVKNEFYKLACSYSVQAGQDRSYIVLSGLAENMPAAMDLMEKVIRHAKPDAEIYSALVERNAKALNDAKSNQSQNFSRLVNYMMYGKENSPVLSALSVDEMRATEPSAFTDAIKRLADYQHRIIYYGPLSEKEAVDAINAHHHVAPGAAPAPQGRKFVMQQPSETVIFIAPYEAKQLYMSQFANNGKLYDKSIEPMRMMYNEYFGGSMNAIVFQEMRESRSLAYSASANYGRPSRLDRPYTYNTMIATQNDKLFDAIEAFNQIINDMPKSESAFELAKNNLDSRLRTERIIKDNIAWSYINAKDMGHDKDSRIALFEALPGMTLDDVSNFQKKEVNGRTYYYCILGDTNDLDLEALGKLGKVVMLTTEDIFGF